MELEDTHENAYMRERAQVWGVWVCMLPECYLSSPSDCYATAEDWCGYACYQSVTCVLHQTVMLLQMIGVVMHVTRVLPVFSIKL
ncbi:hypothetical protein DPMN_063155 [Dreissena polymorpha]|uniref:Uncharacterized protein n=1 Tax=Dreissena polymorpha TaxID=45954 RepID=A0A9D4HJZ3_DREPO|nr:hypothetical protein DPMN_063155 [Dreissena polymorpha]